jgi:streptogramin lyase
MVKTSGKGIAQDAVLASEAGSSAPGHKGIKTTAYLPARFLLVGLVILLTLPGSVANVNGQLAATGSASRDILPGQALHVGAPAVASVATRGVKRVSVTVTLTNTGGQALTVHPNDFLLLSGEGDMFSQAGAPEPPDALTGAVAPAASRSARLTFLAPAAMLSQLCLLYRPDAGDALACVHLKLPAGLAQTDQSTVTTVTEYPLGGGLGDPWGTAVDAAGNVWFAEPGCDFAPICPPDAPPGQLGELLAGSHTLNFYPLPDINGNQPVFVTLDGPGHVWFTTPDNSMIGEFDPKTQQFIGQWPVIPDSGPWDLTFYRGKIWYTEYFISGIGEFDPQTHTYRDFATPTPNSGPYGIAANDPADGNLIWFTENNSRVAQIGVLDIASGQVVEYPIRARPADDLTPHLLALDAQGDPWWTEGLTRAIGTLHPQVAKAGRCGVRAGDCAGVQEFALPPPPRSCPNTHVSGIAIQGKQFIWIDDALAAQVGSFNLSTHQFTLYDLSDCNAHPHDGLVLDAAHHVWWNEEYVNALGELVQH